MQKTDIIIHGKCIVPATIAGGHAGHYRRPDEGF